MFSVSFSAIVLGFIIIIPGKTLSLGVLAISQPSDEFIIGFQMSCLASLWSISLEFDSGSVHSRLLLEYCSDWASPSSYRTIGGNKSLIGCSIGSFNALKAYRHCLSSSKDTAGVRTASLTSGLISVVFKAPVIDLACLFMSFWISSAHVFWPCHQISAPYRAINWTTAIWILRTNPRDRPLVPNIDFSLFSAFLAFCSLVR